MPEVPSGWTSHSALEAHLWARLDRAVRYRGDPWRFVTLATIGPNGPEARTVGLRAADRATATVEVHTDARTPKVDQLRADGRAQLLFWDARTQEQLRLAVGVHILDAPLPRWEDVPASARTNYGTTPAPGTPLMHPEAYTRDPSPNRFAALIGRVHRMDAVVLSSDPHRRAVRTDDGWQWVAP